MRRRRLLGPLLAATAALLLVPPAAASAAATPNSPWSQGNSDAAHSRSNRTETTLSRASVKQLAYQRQISAPKATNDRCPYFDVEDIALSGATVYGNFGGRVSAYDAEAGQLRWHTGVNTDQLRTSVSVADGLVVVGTSTCGTASIDRFHAVTAYRASDGKMVWRRQASGDLYDTVVSDGVVLGHEWADYGNGDTYEQAWDLSSGAPLWTKKTRCGFFDDALVVHGYAMFTSCAAGSQQQNLVAADLHTGRLIWSRPFPVVTVVAGDSADASGRHLYVATTENVLLDIDPTTGATQHTLAGIYVIAVAGSRVFTSDDRDALTAYDIDSGTRSWSARMSVRLGAAANGLLFLDNGKILSAYNGSLVRQTPVRYAEVLAVGDGREAVSQSSSRRRLTLYGVPHS